jgi:glucokinase
MAKADDLILGVDIGGTKVAAALINSSGKILSSSRTPMVARKSAEQGLQSVARAIDRVMLHRLAKNVRAIGVSAPGWIDSANGVVLKTTNLPCWRNFPLRGAIERRYGLPTRLANDANAAALAEAQWGASVGHESSFYVSLGTGLGTGLILQHGLYHGSTGNAGEGGHVTINFRGTACPCGKRGCVEMYVSGTAITRRTRERLRKYDKQKSQILELSHGRLDGVTAEIVAEAASAGDPLATAILRETAEYFAIWLGNIINLLDPEIIVLGGGLSRLMMSLLDPIRNYLDTRTVQIRRELVPIVAAFHGADSALVGAAALCIPNLNTKNGQTQAAK